MKELTILNNKILLNQKEDNNFSRSRSFWFHMYTFQYYECLKWLEKQLLLINTNFYNVVVTDIFHKYRIRSHIVIL